MTGKLNVPNKDVHLPQELLDNLNIVTSGLPHNDGCPLLNRIKTFIIQEATAPTLQHVFRDSNGIPVDLTPPQIYSESAPPMSESLAPYSTDTVLIRAMEFIGMGSTDSRFKWSMEGWVENAAAGIVRVNLDPAMCQQAGLYRLSIGFVRESRLMLVNNCLLSIEPSLFGGRGNGISQHRPGCPTIQEIRMQMWDTSAADNDLLENVEFSDDQLATAIAKPIQQFNEWQPPIRIVFNTTNFPWRSNWMDAIKANLLMFACDYYRRNRLGGAAGGINIDDKNKETEYMRAGQMYMQKWQEFAQNKKYMLNMEECVGIMGSDYTRFGGEVW